MGHFLAASLKSFYQQIPTPTPPDPVTTPTPTRSISCFTPIVEGSNYIALFLQREVYYHDCAQEWIIERRSLNILLLHCYLKRALCECARRRVLVRRRVEKSNKIGLTRTIQSLTIFVSYFTPNG